MWTDRVETAAKSCKCRCRRPRSNWGTGSRPEFRNRMRKRHYAEQELQRSVVAHLKARAVPNTTYLHVPNGGGRSAIEGAILKGQGVKPGCPDILIWSHGKPFALELKTRLAVSVQTRSAASRRCKPPASSARSPSASTRPCVSSRNGDSSAGEWHEQQHGPEPPAP
jgi:hypothetical protein